MAESVSGQDRGKILRSDWLVNQRRWTDEPIFPAPNFPVGPAKNVSFMAI